MGKWQIMSWMVIRKLHFKIWILINSWTGIKSRIKPFKSSKRWERRKLIFKIRLVINIYLYIYRYIYIKFKNIKEYICNYWPILKSIGNFWKLSIEFLSIINWLIIIDKKSRSIVSKVITYYSSNFVVFLCE